MAAPLEYTLWGTGGFLNFMLAAEIFVAHFRVYSDPPKDPKISRNISASKTKFKNHLGALERILLRDFYQKYHMSRCSVWL